jgi:hypothetical protein
MSHSRREQYQLFKSGSERQYDDKHASSIRFFRQTHKEKVEPEIEYKPVKKKVGCFGR